MKISCYKYFRFSSWIRLFIQSLKPTAMANEETRARSRDTRSGSIVTKGSGYSEPPVKMVKPHLKIALFQEDHCQNWPTWHNAFNAGQFLHSSASKRAVDFGWIPFSSRVHSWDPCAGICIVSDVRLVNVSLIKRSHQVMRLAFVSSKQPHVWIYWHNGNNGPSITARLG